MERILIRVRDVLWSPYLWMGVAFISLAYAYWITRKLILEPFQNAMLDMESGPKACPHIVNSLLANKKALETFKQRNETDNIKTYESIVASIEKKVNDMECYKYVQIPEEPKQVIEPYQQSVLTPAPPPAQA